ncbi:hypothetical protein E0E52_20330 [Azotobacter chroococcum]|nr:hypothetical protein E0E52_20330 [Azotobacter chroococcum]
MAFPCQVPQRRMAPFAAQPEGTGLFLRDVSLLDGSFGTTKLRVSRLASRKNGLRRGRVVVSTGPMVSPRAGRSPPASGRHPAPATGAPARHRAPGRRGRPG